MTNLIERLKTTKEMMNQARERFAATDLPGTQMDDFEHLLLMPVEQMKPADLFNLVMFGAIAAELNNDARPDETFGDEAKCLNNWYYEENFYDEKKLDVVHYNLLLVCLAPLNPDIVLDGNIGREADIAMGYFMALRHELEND